MRKQSLFVNSVLASQRDGALKRNRLNRRQISLISRSPKIKRLRLLKVRLPKSFISSVGREVGSKEMYFRTLAIGAGVCLFCLCVLWRLYDLHYVNGEVWQSLAAKQHETSIQVQGARGEIFDSTGRMLAASVQAVSLGVHPRRIKDKENLAEVLAPLIGKPKGQLMEELNKDVSFAWLAKGLPQDAKKTVNALGISGIEFFPDTQRYYPQGNLAGVILGRVGQDGKGQSGVELTFNKQLSAADYQRAVKRDALGRYVFDLPTKDSISFGAAFNLISNNVSTEALAAETDRNLEFRNEGSQVTLTIDTVIQNIIEEEFNKAHLETKAKNVFGLIMDADTGEIVAMAQTPGFDPNQDKITQESLRNLSIQNSFEPGSTLKPIVAAAALDKNYVKANQIFDCENGKYKVGKHTIRDVHPIGIASFRDVLVRSSNICMTKMGQMMGAKELHESLLDFGLGEETSFELSGEESGILRSVSNWRAIDVATHSFGQGVALTAVQLTRAYAVIANGGYLVSPHIVKSNSIVKRKRILSAATANSVAEALVGVTEDEHGTGRNAAIAGVKVSGKTGTAQKAKKGSRGYDTNRVLSSFIGFVKGDDSRVKRSLVMLVVVDEPGVRPRWGGVVAAPVFRQVMKRTLSYLVAREEQTLKTALLNTEDLNNNLNESGA
jgi:cell division protein FtsI (penicillin-binding protein 3)